MMNTMLLIPEELRGEMLSVAETFLRRAQRELACIRVALAAVAPAGSRNAQPEDQIILLAHRMRGTAAIFGFSTIAKHAGELELQLTQALAALDAAQPIARAQELLDELDGDLRQALASCTDHLRAPAAVAGGARVRAAS